MSKSTPLIFEIRKKNAGYARRMDKGSPLAAIKLGCLECCGDNREEVKNCISYRCVFWSYRFGKGFEEKPKGVYPTLPAKKKGNPNFGK